MSGPIAIIGGTGVGSRLEKLGGKPIHVPTRYGWMRGRLLQVGGVDVVLASRHGVGHKTPPHDVPYRANALGLAKLGVKHVIATAACGSLRTDWRPGDVALCSDFVDLTFRNQTLFEDQVSHVDFSVPMGDRARVALFESAISNKVSLHDGAVYAGLNGPRYETPFEVRMLGNLGADVVGMTASSEAVAMREAGLDYSCLAIITNFGCGLQVVGELSHHDVVATMERVGPQVLHVLLDAARALGES